MFLRPLEDWARARRTALQSPEGRWRSAALAGSIALLGVTLFSIVAPMLATFETYGFHDWDVETAFRYITVLSLKTYGEGPWWHPFLCGGIPGWGGEELGSNFISPYLPLYLLTDVRVALRLEVVGQAILGLVGSVLLARRFTKSYALASLVAVLFVFNGRWALQAAVGHTWHLQYALLPWALFFFDRSLEPGRLRNTVGAAAALAAMCFWGGIYPLPHSALLLSGYALLLAVFTWSLRPVLALALTGSMALGFAAPKMFAIIDHMQRIPRLIESKEVIGLRELLVMLTDPTQRFGSRPIAVPAYNWHEWGIYVGPAGVVCLCCAVVFARGARGQTLKILGLLCLLLGFGAFHKSAPWALLHELPVFASQHVPSRYHYPMVLLLTLAFVSVIAPWVDRTLTRRAWLDLLLLVPIALIAADVARVSRVPFSQAFWMEKPESIRPLPLFEHHTNAPLNYQRRDWAVPIFLSMLANTGVLKCYGVDLTFTPGALAADARGYRGPAYVESSHAQAKVVAWSPNRAVVEVSGAEPGAWVVYNMNYDPSWRANGEPAVDREGRVATRLEPGTSTITFRYFPRTFRWSLPLFVLTLAGALFIPSRRLDRLRQRCSKLCARLRQR